MEKIKEFVTVQSGYGNGSGYGYGSGNGDGGRSGYGSGSGYGYGGGSGNGDGNGDGNGYGDGSGDGNGYGDGSGNGYGGRSGDGSGSGYGYGDGSDVKSINGMSLYNIDGIQTIITSLHKNVAKGLILNSDLTFTSCYVVKQNNTFAHGKTIQKAMQALQDKQFKNMSEEERIEKFLKHFSDTAKKYPVSEFYEWHNKLTGSCEMGRKQFAKEHDIDIDNDEMTVSEFIKITKNSFGGEIIRKLENEEQAQRLADKLNEEESLKSDVMACKSKIPPVNKVVKAPATEEEKKQAVAMYKMGKGVCEIARETGRAQSTISRWVGASVSKKQTPFGDIIRKVGREHAIVDGECTDEFDKEIDEVEMTIKKASAELKTEKSKSKTLMQAVEGIEPKHDYKAEFEESQKKNEFTKADILTTTEKEPATVAPATSSNEIKSTDSITLSEQNVNLAVEMLRLASDTLDQIYKSDEFNSLNTGLAVGFGRAWGVIDMAVDLLNMEGK